MSHLSLKSFCGSTLLLGWSPNALTNWGDSAWLGFHILFQPHLSPEFLHVSCSSHNESLWSSNLMFSLLPASLPGITELYRQNRLKNIQIRVFHQLHPYLWEIQSNSMNTYWVPTKGKTVPCQLQRHLQCVRHIPRLWNLQYRCFS